MVTPAADIFFKHQVGTLLARLDEIKPFTQYIPMVMAAAPTVSTRHAIDRYLAASKTSLYRLVNSFRDWLSGPAGRAAPDNEAQRRFIVLRLRFQKLLTHFDVFSDVLTQRSENDFGTWLNGLDVLASDALVVPGAPYDPVALICRLERGIGAAIRRARTRLPGGGKNPIAIIRVPRERMIGTGIGGSLVHEVGHQGAALLDLVPSLRAALQRRHQDDPSDVWLYWDRWISEIVADLWSVAHIGVGATYGMIGVVTLPRAFIFRLGRMDAPHPPPWVRVHLSAAMGEALFPDPQWRELRRLWTKLYPPHGLHPEKAKIFADIEASMPEFVELLLSHRPRSLSGETLGAFFPITERQPSELRKLCRARRKKPCALTHENPTVAFAALGQARADGVLSPANEEKEIKMLLTHWATQSPPTCGCQQ